MLEGVGQGVGLDIPPDGARMIAVKRETRGVDHLGMVVNWFDELRRRVDAGG